MSKEEVYNVVQETIMDVLPDVEKENIAIEKQLKDIGANSIDRMEIVTMSMRELNIKIPLMSFAGVNNIEGLVNVLHENVNS
ncbi:acyl carrier protein [Kordia zhangzhouensis]|uniref:acyl carrier protein n=1 Tax=Kordia zhangzhouensis TaxID=1620405 RepID=UPI0006298350|nr:acyl carrier protein [Kordia zhangzhouensis]